MDTEPYADLLHSSPLWISTILAKYSQGPYSCKYMNYISSTGPCVDGEVKLVDEN